MDWRLLGYPIAGAYAVRVMFSAIVGAARRRKKEEKEIGMLDEVHPLFKHVEL